MGEVGRNIRSDKEMEIVLRLAEMEMERWGK